MENISIYIASFFKTYLENTGSSKNLHSNVNVVNLVETFLATFNISNEQMKILATLFSNLSAILIIFITLFIILYFLKAIGLYIIAKNKNISFSYFSFVPLGFFYVLGKIVGKTRIYGIEIDKPEYLLIFFLLSAVILPFYRVLTFFVFLLTFYALLYRLYESLTYSFRIPLILLSITFPFLIPVFIFGLRNKC